MPHARLMSATLFSWVLLALPCITTASDTDGAGDCQRSGADYGDAPEGFDAYSGILGRFPTCSVALTPAGTQDLLGCGPFSTPPGAAAGYVRHAYSLAGFWLGCSTGSDIGLDGELDGKTSPNQPSSACGPVSVDCFQTAFGLTFGQDECYGDDDAGLVAPVSFVTCATSTITFRAYNCSSTARGVYLNVLVDWNHDGDWNDAEQCQAGGPCAPEWALKNRLIMLTPGCAQRISPTFVAGTSAGNAWMRITLSDVPVSDDFPWAGSANMPGGQFSAGETEDYPVQVVTESTCPGYIDFGDAPENIAAYSNGAIGHFPTCLSPSGPGGQSVTVNCPARSTIPGNTGFVRHVAQASNPDGFWLGCPTPGGLPPDAVDSETDGKVNLTGAGAASSCNPNVFADCAETLIPGLTIGQDECYGDADAALGQPMLFYPCQLNSFQFKAYSCASHDQTVYVNVLFDWNQDGDWNDNLECPGGPCAPEWAIKNVATILTPGCNTVYVVPVRAGPNGGEGWLRITLTRTPVPDDFPWNGSAGVPGLAFDGGETEDYPFRLNPPIGDPGPYNDRGDAPEGFLRYPFALGSDGNYPTCTLASPPSTQTILGGCPAPSTPPGPAGFVNHVHPGAPTPAAWLGCGLPGVDSEPDGKTNVTSFLGQVSACDMSTIVDCDDNTIGITYGADECPGDGDAGIATPFVFPRCQQTAFSFQAANASSSTLPVYINVLVDWNDDGDWNDVDYCPYQGGCAPEWAVKNYIAYLTPGCNTISTPSFQTGRGYAVPSDLGRWMRLTLTFQPLTDDFPWAGSSLLPGQMFQGGETEDYVFYMDGEFTPCLDTYEDFGDAPENMTAYPNGVIGQFPTCSSSGSGGTQSSPAGCATVSTAPSFSGEVVHVSTGAYSPFWFGCATATPPFSVDDELRAKVNLTGAGTPTQCPQGNTLTDCQELLAPLTFGQDECYGDVDAGLASPVTFAGCGTTTIQYKLTSCGSQSVDAYLNVLVDWNRDGDWNDVERCGAAYPCAPEWAVKNQLVHVGPGCGTYTTPPIQAAGSNGPVWMRFTITPTPVNNDFPWAGSSTESPGHLYYDGGETEDYVANITGSLVGVETISAPGFELLPPVPNPARVSTSARFTLPRSGVIRLSIYDAAGRHVRTLVDGLRPAGEHTVAWDYHDATGGEVAPGVYLMRLQFAGRVLTQRVVRLQ